MKKIEAVFKPFKLEDVKHALEEIGVQGMTVVEVKGFGLQRPHAEIYRGSDFSGAFLPKIKIEVVTTTDRADAVVNAILKAANTGSIGDGKIFISEIVEVIHIRSGERGVDALT